MRLCTRTVTGAVLVAACAMGLSSCASQQKEEPHFARTSAHVVQEAGTTFPINLILVAKPDSPIFSDYKAISLGELASIDASAAPVVRGEVRDGLMLANIKIEVPITQHKMSFNEVTVEYGSGARQKYNVGSWVFEPDGTPGASLEIADWPAAMPRCEPFSREFPSSVADGVDGIKFSADQPGVELDGGVKNVEGGPKSAYFKLKCDPKYDFFVISMGVNFENSGHSEGVSALAPIMVGYMDISDQLVKSIVRR